MPFDASRLIDDRYKIIKKLNSGGQGSVYLARNKHGEKFAVKVARGRRSLKKEYEMYRLLGSVDGYKEHFPSIYSYVRQRNYSMMVMTMFEKSLQDLKRDYGGSLSMRCVLKTGIHLIKVINEVHSKGIMHLDLKPSNIMTRTKGERKSKLHIIDFGMARLYRSRSGEHVPDGRWNRFQGTVMFSSQWAHRYKRPSRRDDMESLGFLLVYLVRGRLPWADISKSDWSREFRAIGSMKRNLPLQEMCEGTVGIRDYMKEVRNLSFKSRPNYSKMIFCLQQAAHCSLRKRPKYDWE